MVRPCAKYGSVCSLVVLVAILILAFANLAYAQATTTSLTVPTPPAPPSPSTLGEAVTFTATVTGGTSCPGVGTCPSGQVQFLDSGVLIGTATLNGSATNQAVFTTAALRTGNHSITAHYSGDGTFSPSDAAAVSYDVGKRGTTLALGAPTPSPVGVGSASTIAATVTDTGPVPGGGTPGAFALLAATADLSTGRSGHTATLLPFASASLPNGMVLIAGGRNSSGTVIPSVGSAEIFNVATQTFTALGSGLNTPRTGHTATWVPDGTPFGKVLIVGGTDASGNPLASAELYDPALGTFSAGAALNIPRTGHTATWVPDGTPFGKVLITGGTGCAPTPCTPVPLDTAEVYSAGAFTPVSGTLAVARSGHTATLLADAAHILLTGGDTTGTAELITYNSITTTVTSSGTANWTTARSGHTATLLPDGNVLLAGGLRSGVAVGTVELYQVPASLTPFPTTFTTVTPTGMNTPRAAHTATLLDSALVLIVGGVDAAPSTLSSVETYTPSFDPTGQATIGSDEPTDSLANCTLSVSGTGVTTCSVTDTPTQVGTTPRALTVTYSGDANHTAPAAEPASLAVQKGTPVISWNNPLDITYGTALGATQLDATANVPGTFTYTPPAGTVLNAGVTQLLSVDFVPTDTTNYNSATATVNINVLKATPTVTWANPADIAYGTALNGTQLNATFGWVVNGSPVTVAGTPTYTPASGTVLNAGAGQSLSVSFAPTDTTNYNPASGTATINVLKAIPTVTWANPADITYGTALNGTQLNATFTAVVNGSPVTVAGTPTYTPATGTLLNAGNAQSLSVSFAPTDTANYGTATGTASLNVLKATPTVTWTNPADITYGTVLNGTQLNATFSWVVNGSPVTVTGAPTYTPASGTVLNAGSPQSLSVSFAPTDTANYDTATGTASINVLKATPTVTWPNPADITYGTALNGTQLNAAFTWIINGTPSAVAGTPTYTPASGTVLNAGNGQSLSVSFAPTDTTNYNPATGAATINVLKATPTVTWPNPADITYGTALNGTQLNATVTWIVGGSPVTVAGVSTYTPAAGTLLNAGASQTLHVAFAPTDTANYNSTSHDASINVLKATPTVTWANPADITYGTVLNGTQLNATFGWVVNGSPVTVAGTPTYTPAAGAVPNAGTGQTLSVSFAPTDTANYNPATGTATINVLKATPTVTWANPADITYGTVLNGTQLNATFGWVVNGSPVTVAGAPTYTPASGTVLNAGAGQSLSVSFAPTDTTNYNPATGTATINVLQATPTVTWSNPADITYGTALSGTQLNAAFTAIVNGAPVTVTGTPTYTPAAGTVLNAGASQTLHVAFVPTDTTNYTGASRNVAINVLQATPTVNWSNPADITYGTALSGTQLNATFTAVVNGAPVTVAGAPTYTPAAATVLNAGASQTLHVAFVPTDTTNYTNASRDVSINVLQATPTVNWTNPADITYGTALNGQLNATFTAVVNGAPVTVAGTPTYTPAAGTVLNAGASQTLHVAFAPTDTVNYTSASRDVPITVLQATPIVTWANPADISYGVALSSTQLNATFGWVVNGTPVTVAGNPTYTPAAGTVLNAGAGQTLHLAFAPTDAVNYTSASRNVSINVLKADTTTRFAVAMVPMPAGNVYTFTATVAHAVSGRTGTPGGTVNFSDGGTPLGSGTLNGSGVATLTTTFAPPASGATVHAIAVNYLGNDPQSNFNASSTAFAVTVTATATVVPGTSAGVSVPVQNPAGSNVTLDLSSASLRCTVQSATVTTGIFPSCTASAAPTALAPGGSGTVTVTLATTARAAAPPATASVSGSTGLYAALGMPVFVFLGFALPLIPSRKKRPRGKLLTWLGLVLVIAIVTFGLGCGGGGFTNTANIPAPTGNSTQPGSYVAVITYTGAGGQQHLAAVPFNVTP